MQDTFSLNDVEWKKSWKWLLNLQVQL